MAKQSKEKGDALRRKLDGPGVGFTQ